MDSLTGVLTFEQIDAHVDPFMHFICGEFYSPAAAALLLQWLKETPLWREQQAKSYHADGFILRLAELPTAIREHFSPRLVTAVKQKTEAIYQVPLAPNVRIEVYRYGPGHHTDVHTDCPASVIQNVQMFTHRLIVYLNDGWDESMGGRLKLFRKSEPDQEPILARAYQPLHNTAASMAFSEQSIHQVEPVAHGNRYNIVWSFRTADGSRQGHDRLPFAFRN